MISTQTLLEQVKTPIVLVTAESEITFFNTEAKSLFEQLGWSVQNGIHLTDVLTREQQPFFRRTLQSAVEKGHPETREVEYKIPGSRTLCFEEMFNPVSYPGGTTLICILYREITSQKATERKSSQLIREFQQFNENANAVIFAVDSRGYITDWNNECVRITGVERKDIFQNKAAFIVHPVSQEAFAIMLTNVLQGNSISGFECRLSVKGESLTILVNGTPRKNMRGGIIGAWFVGQDISELIRNKIYLEQRVRERTAELKEALEKEKTLVEVKNKFVSIASHEFKVPLASISSIVNSLYHDPLLSEDTRNRLVNIGRQTSHMKALLDDILTIERTDNLKIKANRNTFDIIPFLQTLSNEVAASTRNTHEIKTKFERASIFVESDEKLFRQIFLNLLSNAIKFSPGASSIFLTVESSAGILRVIVRDTGIGIPEQDKTKLFERFHRGSNVTDIEGTGLGLSIVKKAVDILDGELRVDSEAGNGTTFTIIFRGIEK